MAINATHVEKMLRSVPGALGGQKWSLAQIARDAESAMIRAGVNTPEGAASFLAQTCYESSWFRKTEETLDKKGTRLRARQEEYIPYIGRGVVQRTWLDGYQSFGRWAKAHGVISDAEYFVRNPEQLARDEYAWLTMVEYSDNNGLAELMNAGRNKDVGRIIHAGPGRASSAYPLSGDDGRYERERETHTMQLYWAALKAGVPAPGPEFYEPKGVSLSVKEIQSVVGVSPDGEYGDGTKAAVAEWQRDALGVEADGLWGPGTEKAHMALIDEIKALREDVKEVRSKVDQIPVDGNDLTLRYQLSDATAAAIGWGKRSTDQKTMTGQGMLQTSMRLSADAANGIARTETEVAEIADAIDKLSSN